MILKRLRLSAACLLFLIPFAGLSQTIEIHQIDVGVGDATLIKINNPGGLTKTILIDAGKIGAGQTVIEYLSSPTGGNLGPVPYIDYLISSHYHEDHIGGFVGTKKRQYGNCYNYNGVIGTTGKVNVFAILDKGIAEPVPGSTVYQDYGKLASTRRKKAGPGGNAIIAPPPHTVPPPLPGANQAIKLGGYIDLGVDGNNVPIRLRLWVADGYLYAPNSPPNYYINLAAAIDRNNPGSYRNPNNWGLVWVLEYGMFRYFTGGDIGGENTASYLDIETPLMAQLKLFYTTPLTAPGHICSFKSDHHGSEHSTNQAFLDDLKPTVGVISCGGQYNHPTQDVIDRMEAATWNIAGLTYHNVRNYYMTELHYLDEIDTSRGLTSGNVSLVATSTTVPPNIISQFFQMANLAYLYWVKKDIAGDVHGNIKILVYPDDGHGHTINQLSEFVVRWRDYNGGAWLPGWRYACHQ